MVEDDKTSDIWYSVTSDVNEYDAANNVHLLALLTVPGTETGIYFSAMDPKILYVNIQHSEAEYGDGTWANTLP